MSFRRKISEIRAHKRVLRTSAVKFLKNKKEFKENQMITIEVSGYSHEIFLRAKTSDLPTFYQCIFNKEYDIKLSTPPKTIIDLGANIGLTSLFFNSKYPEAKIIAVEPEKSNFELLEKNTLKIKNITILEAGIWNKDASLIVKDDNRGNYGFTVEEVEEGTLESIKAVSIETIMRENDLTSIDLLKIDIEGSEKELFEENIDYWLSKTKTLIVEFHDRFKSDSAKTVFRALDKYDYEFDLKGENVIFTFKS
jgi:FkbM family methyltransferase